MVIKRAPGIDVRELRYAFGVSREKLARLLGVSAKTIERWEVSAGSPGREALSVRLAQLQQIAQLGRIVYTADGFVRYIKQPLPVFDGRSAQQLIEQGRESEVLSALSADYEGGSY